MPKSSDPLRLTAEQKRAWGAVRRALEKARNADLDWVNEYGKLIPYSKSIVKKIIPDDFACRRDRDKGHEIICVLDLDNYYDESIDLNAPELCDDPRQHYIVLQKPVD